MRQLKQVVGETRPVQYDGHTYSVSRLNIHEYPAVVEWLRDYRRRPYAQESTKISASIAAEVLTKLETQPLYFWSIATIVEGQYFVLYLALRKAVKEQGQGQVNFSEKLVREKTTFANWLDLQRLCEWLLAIEVEEETDKDPLDQGDGQSGTTNGGTSS